MDFGPAPDQLQLNGEWLSLIASSEDHDTPADQEMMMNMTKTLTEQNGFFADFSSDYQTRLGATLRVSVESPGQDKVLWAVW